KRKQQDALVMTIFLLHLDEMRNAITARASPRGPELDHDHAAFQISRRDAPNSLGKIHPRRCLDGRGLISHIGSGPDRRACQYAARRQRATTSIHINLLGKSLSGSATAPRTPGAPLGEQDTRNPNAIKAPSSRRCKFFFGTISDISDKNVSIARPR